MPLTFDPIRHLYYLDGQQLPHVTQVLADCGLTDSTWFRQEHRDRGSAAHELCAEIAVLEHPSSQFEWDGGCGCGGGPECKHQIAIPYGKSYQRWVRQSGFVVEPGMIEVPVHSAVWRCAGTFDQWGWLGGKKTLVDLKTGEPQEAAAIQLAGYRLMAKESRGIEVEQSFCLWLDKDGGFPRIVQSKSPQQDERIFQSLLEVWWWRKSNGCLRNGTL